MSLLDSLLGIVAPHDCLACGAEGNLLCGLCAGSLQGIPDRCYRCRKLMNDSLTCEKCRQTSLLYSVKVAAVYGSVAKGLIWKLKLGGAQSSARIMAKYMAQQVRVADRSVIIPVPTATSRIRQRGYDQARLIARELSLQTRAPYFDRLRRVGQMHQHGLSRQARLSQLSAVFRLKRPEQLRGRHVLLVDDVITTGATLEAAALVLRSAGAKRVEAVVFAQPEFINNI
ncbi:MAG TPA: ComF family protein [Candidatus Saccharimonadales bacterium]|nr:ComF family protein [Candidatus Saccharimonadales bacterium]